MWCLNGYETKPALKENCPVLKVRAVPREWCSCYPSSEVISLVGFFLGHLPLCMKCSIRCLWLSTPGEQLQHQTLAWKTELVAAREAENPGWSRAESSSPGGSRDLLHQAQTSGQSHHRCLDEICHLQHCSGLSGELCLC